MFAFTPAKSLYLFKQVLKNVTHFVLVSTVTKFMNVILNYVKFVFHKIKIDFLRPEAQS